MASSGTWINPVVRYRINQDSLKQDMQEYPDIESGQFHDVDANFGATLNDTIAVINMVLSYSQEDYGAIRYTSSPQTSEIFEGSTILRKIARSVIGTIVMP
jgi:hypothetical protein